MNVHCVRSFLLKSLVVALLCLSRCRSLHVPAIFKSKTTSASTTTLPKALKFDNLEYSRLAGCFPAFRNDTASCLLQHAEYCWKNNLPGVRISVGLFGQFDLVVDSALVDFIMSDNNSTSTEGIFYKSALDRRGVGLLTGKGVLLSDGPDHTRKRRLIVPSFDTKSLNDFLTTMDDVSKEYANQLAAAADEKPCTTNVPQLTSAIAMKIVGLCLFATNVVGGEIYSDIQKCLTHVVYVSRNPIAAPNWLPTPRNRKFHRALQTLDDLVFGMIDSGKARLEKPSKGQGGAESSSSLKLDLLGMLLKARYDNDKGGSKLTDSELRDEIMTLFLAGHETSAVTLSWAMWFLAQPENQKWQDRIADEYDQIQAKNAAGSSGFTMDTVQKDPEAMKYTRAVLCETLRLRGPSYAVDREVQEDTRGPGGVFFKRGSILIVSPMVLHLNPKHFTDPQTFDPTRFLTWGADPWDGPFGRSVYLPFGAGRKRCIGYRFAQWEMLVILCTLVKKLRISRAEAWKEVGWDAGITLRPDLGLELVFESRK